MSHLDCFWFAALAFVVLLIVRKVQADRGRKISCSEWRIRMRRLGLGIKLPGVKP